MSRSIAIVFVILAISSACFAAPADSQLPPHRDGVLLVRFRSGVALDRINAILGAAGAAFIKRIGVETSVINVGSGRVGLVLQLLKPFSELLYVEPDFATVPPEVIRAPRPAALVTSAGSMPLLAAAASSGLPNDTFITNEWAALNTGQNVDGVAGTAGADQRSSAAWGVTTGTPSVVVAVLDTGIQYTHPDLFTNVWSN